MSTHVRHALISRGRRHAQAGVRSTGSELRAVREQCASRCDGEPLEAGMRLSAAVPSQVRAASAAPRLAAAQKNRLQQRRRGVPPEVHYRKFCAGLICYIIFALRALNIREGAGRR